MREASNLVNPFRVSNAEVEQVRASNAVQTSKLKELQLTLQTAQMNVEYEQDQIQMVGFAFTIL